MTTRNNVTLCEERGETSIYIDAEITDDGALQLSGQDIGRAPEEFWGDSDYEYWLVIPAEEKDRVLLALLERIYKGNRCAVSELQSFLKERNIPHAFHSWA
jgi:hypothetical protein